MPDSKPPVLFVHLSDIHFTRKTADGISIQNNDIRNEVLKTAEARTKDIGQVTGVLISGDIAYAAKPDQYVQAKQWLDELCKKVKCAPENVWVVPGNHDVDRDAISDSPILQQIQRTIRAAPPDQIDYQIRTYVIEEKTNPELLYSPLQNYLSFASIYSCNHERNNPIWTDEIPLNDSSILLLVGLNSTLISNSLDDDGANKLVLGGAQLDLPRRDGVEYLTLCHHPPQWLRDQDSVEVKLRERVRLQLFGHKHAQVCEEIDRKSIRLVAGAMHPDKREPDWEPRYNLIAIEVAKKEDGRNLCVQIHPQIWSKQDLTFLPGTVRTYDLKLPDWQPLEEVPDTTTTATRSDEVGLARKAGNMNSRRLAYRFLSLPFTQQLDIAQKLGLIEEDDKGLQDQQLFLKFFDRARTLEVLEELEREIEETHQRNSHA